MQIKQVTLDGQTLRFGASGNTPFLYMSRTGRDINKDMSQLYAKFKDVKTDEEAAGIPFGMEELEIFADIAYTMAYQGAADRKDFPETRTDWLDSLDAVFTIYSILPAIFDLWGMNTKQTVEAKKNPARQHGK